MWTAAIGIGAKSCLLWVYNPSRVKTAFGRRAFSSAAPQIWNHIPTAIRASASHDSFKRHLKTHYFASPIDSPLATPRTSDLNFFNFGALPNVLHYITDTRTRTRMNVNASSLLYVAMKVTIPIEQLCVLLYYACGLMCVGVSSLKCLNTIL